MVSKRDLCGMCKPFAVEASRTRAVLNEGVAVDSVVGHACTNLALSQSCKGACLCSPAADLALLDQFWGIYRTRVKPSTRRQKDLNTLLLPCAAAFFCSLNFETMQQEPSADHMWAQVVDEMHLTPEQRRKVYLAFQCYMTQRASLLQQQQQLAQELRELLSPAVAVSLPGSKAPAQRTSSSNAGSPGVLSHTNNCAGTAVQGELQADPASAGASSAGSPGAAAVDSRSRSPEGTGAGTPSAAGGLSAQAAPTAAGMQPRSACASAGSGGAAGSEYCKQSSCSSLVPGTIDLNAAMRAEVVLEELDRNTRLQRAASRQLILFYIDLLATEQHASALLAAYPYSVKVPAGGAADACSVSVRLDLRPRQPQLACL